jgi:CubicO group peptidase (beta-lactamase class C family)
LHPNLILLKSFVRVSPLLSFSTILIFLLALTSCQEKKEGNPKGLRVIEVRETFDTSFDPLDENYIANKREEILKILPEILDTNDFSGGMLIAKNGQIIYENYSGFGSYKLQHTVHSYTALHLASVSKVLTATAILRLVDQGKLNLDDKIQKTLPTFPYAEISLRMLLNHRSGLPKYEYFTDKDSIWGRSKILKNKDILMLLNKYKFPLYFEPDGKFTYTNTNFAILALVIERVTKKSYPKAMKDLIFKPLHMRHSFVFEYPKDRYRRSQSYRSDFKKESFTNLDAIYGDKNIYSTPRDMLKYDLAMYNDEFLSAKLKEEMYCGYSYERHGVNNYGLGIRLKEWENGSRLLYHHGWWHGNTSTYVTMKSDTVTIIGLSNKYSRRIYHLNKLGEVFRSQNGDSLID